MPDQGRTATEGLRIERARRDVVRALDSMLTTAFDLDHLRTAVEESEQIMFLKLREAIAALLTTTGLATSPDGRYLFDASGHCIEINVARDPKRPDILIAAALWRSPTDADFAWTNRQRRLNAVGRYREFSLLVPKRFSEVATLATDVAVALIEAGCHWIADEIAAAATTADVALAANLYRELQTIVPEDDWRRNLWFAVVGEHLGFRLLDRSVVNPAFDLIDETADRLREDTLELVAELVRTRLPRDGLLMNAALAEDRPLEMRFSDAQYTKEGSIYAVALRALYGGDSLYIMPVLKTPRRSVLLLFPSGNTALRDRLADHAQELRSLCSRNEKAIAAALDRFERQTQWKVPEAPPDQPGLVTPETLRVPDWTPEKAQDVAKVLQQAVAEIDQPRRPGTTQAST